MLGPLLFSRKTLLRLLCEFDRGGLTLFSLLPLMLLKQLFSVFKWLWLWLFFGEFYDGKTM